MSPTSRVGVSPELSPKGGSSSSARSALGSGVKPIAGKSSAVESDQSLVEILTSKSRHKKNELGLSTRLVSDVGVLI